MAKPGGRLNEAMAQRQQRRTERTLREQDLGRIEFKLEKRQRALAGLRASRNTVAAKAPAAPTRPPTFRLAEGLASPAPDAAHTSTPIKEAKARLAALEGQLGIVEKQFKNVLRPRAEAAKKALQDQRTAATALLLSEGVLPVLHQELATDRLKLCERFGLPDIYAEAHGATPPFQPYLAAFTEADSTGALQLRPELLQGTQCSTALSALCEAATCIVGNVTLLSEALVPRYLPAVDLGAMVTGTPAEATKLLEGAISAALYRVMATKLPRWIDESAALPGGRAARPEMERRRTVREAATRAVPVLALLHRHRQDVQASLLDRATQVLSIIADDYRAQPAVAEPLERQWQARRQDMQASLRQAQGLRAECEAARATLLALRKAGQADLAATPPPVSAAAPPVDATDVPATSTMPSGPDLEARIFKLTGDLAGLAEQRTVATGRLKAAVDADQAASREELKAQAAYDMAEAAHGRAQDSARRARAEARLVRAARHVQLAGLESQVSQAREALMRHPALAGLLATDSTLTRAIERHVEPDDKALLLRAKRDTGYAAAYHSLGHLMEAACDVYEDAARQWPDLFAASSLREFQVAADAVTKTDDQGLTDRVHKHQRTDPIARGYSSDLDQTERATPVNESCYSLRWQGGRVLISHLYPHVPHRQLRTLAP